MDSTFIARIMDSTFIARFIYHLSGKNSTDGKMKLSERKNSCGENKKLNNTVDNPLNFNTDKVWRTFHVRVRELSPNVTFYETLRKDQSN
ncbi:MAG: hypothetical protein K0S32_1370 [Bacteroidetes bacterium]|nr:hypothetical protein [Bacteroidota bacterium]